MRRLPPVPGRMQPIDEAKTSSQSLICAHANRCLAAPRSCAQHICAWPCDAVFGSAGLRDREKRRMNGRDRLWNWPDLCVLTAEDPRTRVIGRDPRKRWRAGRLRRGGVEEKTFWRVPDRGRAVAFACSLARSGDVVISCGKGHEQSMCFGTIEYPWDDRDALRAALRGTPLLTLPTAAES